MSRLRHLVWLVALLGALTFASAAQADWHQAIRDCNLDGRLHQHYSQADIQKALQNLPTDIREYTDCQAVLQAALVGSPGPPGGPQLSTTNPALVTPSGAVAGSPADLNALGALGHKAPHVAVGGHVVIPGPGGIYALAGQRAENTLPLPVLLSLLALAGMGALAGLFSLRRGLPATRRLALRLLRR